ncbi:MAG TPA: helix-turn-helix domain-containing protein [Methylomirabilota bacterium]|nr:helix-turn-helix domain-containing protein [Methylomirabilota bacterium]
METLTLRTETPPFRTEASIRIGNSCVNLRSGAAQNPSGAHRLRRKELELLAFLYQHTGAVFSRDELLRRVWNYQGGVLTRTVDQTVATLRRKLNDGSAKRKHLVTVYGIGYRLQPS